MARQKERVYSLILGDRANGQGFEITDLHIDFDVTKSADNKRRGNGASIRVMGLNEEHIALLEHEMIYCSLSIGYKEDGGAKLLVSGNVVEVNTLDKGPDVVTQITMGEAYVNLTQQKVRGLVPEGFKIEKALDEIKDQLGLEKGIYRALPLNSDIIGGYPFHGVGRDLLREYCEAYGLEFQVTNNTLYVTGKGGLLDTDKSRALVINTQSGLVESPYRTQGDHLKMKKDKARKPGVQFTALANAELIPGKMVRLESERITGWFRVNTIRFYGQFEGNDWYMDVACSDILEEDQK